MVLLACKVLGLCADFLCFCFFRREVTSTVHKLLCPSVCQFVSTASSLSAFCILKALAFMADLGDGIALDEL